MSSRESYLTFSAGGRTFAIAASRVGQVMRYEEAGDISLIDLTHRFNGTPAVIGPRTCVITIGGQASRPPVPGILPGRTAPDETSGAGERDTRPPIGLIADEATDFVTFDAILAPPDFGPRIALPYLAALAEGREQEPLSIVLDVDALGERDARPPDVEESA